jgi:serine protease AprX
MDYGCKTRSAITILVLLALASAAVASGGLEKMDLALSQMVAKGEGAPQAAVIVQTAPGGLGPGIETMRELGGTLRCRFQSIDGFAATVPVERLEMLAARPWVKRISADAAVREMLDVAAGAAGADVAWNTFDVTGCNVTVAVIDSGITDHGDFCRVYTPEDWKKTPSRILGGVDWVKGKDKYDKTDKCGHGSSIAGIIAGNGLMSRWHKDNHKHDRQFYRHFVGIAPEANLVNCRVLDDYGFGYVSDVMSAIEWCVANAAEYGIRVINLSLGHPVGESYETDPLCQACEYAWSSGIVVVTSAGNWGHAGYSSIFSPGNDPYVITVGAINTMGTPERGDDELCGYSGRGPTPIDHVLKPDLVAPGNRIVSTRHRGSKLEKLFDKTNVVALEYYMHNPRGSTDKESEYFVLSGTSMAAAVVSGACALMIEDDPSLTPDTIKSRLMLTAEKSPQYGPLWQGAGYIWLPAALESDVVAATPARSPWVVGAPDGGVVITPVPRIVAGDNLMWEPIPDAPPPEEEFFPFYPPEPADESYQPAQDPAWEAYEGYPWWPQWACCADLSEVTIFGEDFPYYFMKHGPKPPRQ